MSVDLKAYLEARKTLVDAALDRVLPPETAEPTKVHQAMRYSVLAPVKRLRPILVIAGAEAVGGRAETVLDTMTQTLRIPNRGVKQAGFYVLGGAAMPAILVEIGFVPHPREEKRLKESRYRDEIARAIVSGLGDYKRTWDARARAAAERAR